MARKLEVAITGDTSQLERAFKRASAEAEGFGGKLVGFGKTAGLAVASTAIAAGAAAIAGTVYEMGSAFSSVAEKATLLSETNAIITSTGGAANVTSSHITEMADSLEKMSLADDKEIQKGENLLLTFTNIQNRIGDGNDIYDQATKVMLDMSQVMGQDVSQTAIQMGKALNDPIGGVTALRRVGVQLSDQQQQQVKDFMAVGDIASAQKVIIGELTREFGGAAQAAQDSKPWDLLKDNIDDLAEVIAGRALPYLADFSNTVRSFITSWQGIGAMPTIENVFGSGVADTLRGIGDAFGVIKDKVMAFANNPIVQSAFGSVWGNLTMAFTSFKQALVGLQPAFESLKPYLQLMATIIGGVLVAGIWVFSAALLAVAGVLNHIIVPAINIVAAVLGFLSQTFMSAVGIVAGAVSAIYGAVSSAFAAVVNAVSAAASGAYGAVAGAFGAMVGAVAGAVGGVLGTVAGLGGAILGAIGDLSGILYGAGVSIISGLLSGITDKFSEVQEFVTGIGGWIGDHKGPLDYDRALLIPHGSAIMQGLATGLQRGLPVLDRTLGNITAVIQTPMPIPTFAVAPGSNSNTANITFAPGSIQVNGATSPEATADAVYRKIMDRLERDVRMH